MNESTPEEEFDVENRIETRTTIPHQENNNDENNENNIPVSDTFYFRKKRNIQAGFLILYYSGNTIIYFYIAFYSDISQSICMKQLLDTNYLPINLFTYLFVHCILYVFIGLYIIGVSAYSIQKYPERANLIKICRNAFHNKIGYLIIFYAFIWSIFGISVLSKYGYLCDRYTISYIWITSIVNAMNSIRAMNYFQKGE